MKMSEIKFKINLCGAVFKLLFLLIVGLFTSSHAYALACKNASDGSAFLTDNIITATVPQTLPNGTVIWRSENRTMTVKCWKIRGGMDRQRRQQKTYIPTQTLAITFKVAME